MDSQLDLEHLNEVWAAGLTKHAGASMTKIPVKTRHHQVLSSILLISAASGTVLGRFGSPQPDRPSHGRTVPRRLSS
jgi:hypothetical protein